MSQIYYKSPLTIYVVWHPKNDKGLSYGEMLYNAFCRDMSSPLIRALGIPVLFRYEPAPGSGLPLPIPAEESDNNAIVLLVDEYMFEDDGWRPYIQALQQQALEANTRLFPVALSGYAFSIDDALNKKQFINLVDDHESRDPLKNEKALGDLKSRMLHDLSRMLYRIEEVTEADRQQSPPPVTLFISHAKMDGEVLAAQFRDYIGANLKLNTFFDANDIGDADDFGEAICKNVENSAVVVFLTDMYSTREWCLIEVIVAKRNKSPLVVVNNLEHGEKRSFPYLGNVPTLRYRENCFPKIIDLALYQVLNNLYLNLKLKKEIALYKLDERYTTYQIQNTPELFNYIDIKRLPPDSKKPMVLVLYPDPPLGKEELSILNDIDEHIEFITPSLIHKVL